MKKQLALGVLLCTSLFLVGCGSKTPANTAGNTNTPVVKEETGPVKLGVIAALSGPAAAYGSDVMQGYKAAAEIINENGGINGRELELIIEDGKCNGKDATSAVQKLINVDNVVAIVGGTCSGETIPAGKIAQSQGVPIVSATASSPEVSTIGDYMFRYWNDADAGLVMLDKFESDGVESIAIVYEGTDYAAAYADVVRLGFEGNIVMDTKFDSNENDFTIIAKNLGNILDDVDALVFIPQTEANTIPFIKALDDEGTWEELRGKFMGTETVLTDVTLKELGSLVNGINGVRFPQTEAFGQDTVDLVAKLTDGYEVLIAEIFPVFAADSVDVVADAIAEVGTDGEMIKNYLAGIDENNKRNEYVPNFYFNELGDGQGIPFALVTVEDGEIVDVE